MTEKKVKPFENTDRLLIPLGHWADEFEDFLVMDKQIFHVTDFVDNPGEHGTDTMYFYNIDGNNIIVQCIFYQDYSREEDEEEKTETTYLAADMIFTKGIKGGNDGEAVKYSDGKLNKDQKKWHDELVHLSTPHLIEEDKEDRTPEAVAKIKAFLFFQTLGKEKANNLIDNEINKLGKDISDDDLKELNEIKDTGTIKRSKHYTMLYCLKNMREIAKESGNPHLKQLEEHIKILEDDEKNNS